MPKDVVLSAIAGPAYYLYEATLRLTRAGRERLIREAATIFTYGDTPLAVPGSSCFGNRL